MSQVKFLTDKQLAERYGIHHHSIRNWVISGRLPAPIKLTPGCVRWRLSDIEQWEAERAAEAVAKTGEEAE